MSFSSFASVHSPCALLGADDMPVAMVKRVKIVELVAVLPEAQCLPAPRIPASQTRGGCRTVMHRPVDSLAAMKVTGVWARGGRWRRTLQRKNFGTLGTLDLTCGKASR